MNLFIKTSSNLNYFWNIGSLLIINISIQILLGFFISLHYFFFSNNIFINSFLIFYNFNYGWILRFFHRNITSLIFILILFHINRRLIYKNYFNKNIWFSGLLIFLILIIISFLGYSLINRQIAYWARIVITNFISIIPIIGNKLILIIWGNQYINNILLNRFFSIHFILALLIFLISILHLIILHINKSSNPFNLNNNFDQINLNSLFIFKDILLILIFLYIFLLINIILPIKINNRDNFNFIIIFKTPNHIEPEWYFLFFYSILRSNENKFNGLLIIILSIIIWFFIPFINKTKFISNKFILINKFLLFKLILILTLTRYTGTKISKEPYILFIKLLIFIYFNIFIYIIIISKIINLI